MFFLPWALPSHLKDQLNFQDLTGFRSTIGTFHSTEFQYADITLWWKWFCPIMLQMHQFSQIRSTFCDLKKCYTASQLNSDLFLRFFNVRSETGKNLQIYYWDLYWKWPKNCLFTPIFLQFYSNQVLRVQTKCLNQIFNFLYFSSLISWGLLKILKFGE